ncbi:hypothetical protein BH10PSE2_BH10PSE2_01710 [soil metagenome]
MTLSHTPEGRSPRLSGRLVRPTSPDQPTRHPAICLVSGLAFIAATAVAVHVLFNVLLG